MADTMTIRELQRALTALVTTGHSPDEPILISDGGDTYTVDGVSDMELHGMVTIQCSPNVEEED